MPEKNKHLDTNRFRLSQRQVGTAKALDEPAQNLQPIGALLRLFHDRNTSDRITGEAF